jgi:predicted SAM-dependent methyltransferase
MRGIPTAIAVSGTQPALLNIGCGVRFSRDSRWLNIDLVPVAPDVLAIDIVNGLPFAEAAFTAVYHSHVLEHLDRAEGRELLYECFRVLRPGGILRVVVPDLEQIAIDYLKRLAEARHGGTGAVRRYAWAVMEMCDQMVRRKCGGGMVEFLTDREPEGRAYAERRCGAETRAIVAALDLPVPPAAGKPSARFLPRVIARELREWLIRRLLGKDYHALEIGRFDASGELHRWMYDSFSLTKLMQDIGFSAIVVQSAFESSIDEWPSFALDADPYHGPRKPDSLFMEAFKPTALDRTK